MVFRSLIPRIRDRVPARRIRSVPAPLVSGVPGVNGQGLRVADCPLEFVRVPVSGGRTMHVTIFGPVDGLPTVALHGLGGSTKQNLPALEAVAERYGLRTYAIDLPNHGGSSTVGLFQFHVRHFSDLILEAVQALEIEATVIFGHSFGGQLAALVAEGIPADFL